MFMAVFAEECEFFDNIFLELYRVRNDYLCSVNIFSVIVETATIRFL